MKAACPRCGSAASRVGPAKYSPEDPYGSYRRKLKRIDSGKGLARERVGPHQEE